MRPVAHLMLALSLLAAPSPGQDEPPTLTLERAVEIALGGNRELRAAGARLGAAEAGVDEATSYRRPRLTLDGVVQRTDHPVLVFSNLLSQSSFAAENFALDALNDPDPLSNWQARLRLSQPLWTGGRIRGGIDAAGLERDAAAADQEAARQQVAHRVIESYTAAVLARGELEVTRESLATARAHVALIADLRDAGLVVASDLLQAEVRESEVQELTIRAESAAAVSVAALNLALGRDLDTPVTLPAELAHDGGDAGGDDVELARLVARARERRPDLDAARSRQAASERATRVARAARRPQVGLDASVEANAEDFFGTDGDSWAVTVGLSYDLFDGGAGRARVARAEHRASEAAEHAELLAQAISLEVRRAAFELRAAGQRLVQAEKGVELAERSLEIVADRYREGLTILTELLDAETALTRSRLRRIAATRDVLLARATLDLATGDL